MASLYIGTGHKEVQLVKAIECNRSAKKTLLLDAMRMSREEEMLGMLRKAEEESNSKMKLSLYCTPKLNRLMRWMLPKRYNEAVGVNHLKIYLFDDDVIVSGANLSEQYFQNRTDRYVLIEGHRKLGDYYEGLVEAVSSFCHTKQSFNFDSFIQNTNCDFKVNGFTELKIKMSEFDGEKVLLAPLVQMAPFSIQQDHKFTLEYLDHLKTSQNAQTFFTSGYFNPIAEYQKKFAAFQHSLSVLSASPAANSFFKSKGFSKHIPNAYSYLEHKFFTSYIMKNSNLSLWEYCKPAWTFHGKGLWSFEADQMSGLIGSSNYGHRSIYRDLENQLFIWTNSHDLISKFQNEKNNLFEHAKQMKSLDDFDDRPRGVLLKISTNALKSML